MMDTHRCLVQATVVGVNDASVLYPACIQCYAKMLHNLQTDMWQCVRCNVRCPASKLSWRYRLSLCVADMSACCNLSLFGGTLVQHFGCSANQFHQFLHPTDENNSAVEEETILQALQTTLMGNRYIFCLKTSVLPQRSHLGPSISQNVQPTSLRLTDLLNAQPSSSNSKMCDFVAVQMISTGIVSASQTSSILSVLKKLVHVSKSEQDPCAGVQKSLYHQGENVDGKTTSQNCDLKVCLSVKQYGMDRNRNWSHKQAICMAADCSGCSRDNVLFKQGSCVSTNTMHEGCAHVHQPNLSLDLSDDDTFYQNSGSSQPMLVFSCQSSMEREFPSSINSQSTLEQEFKSTRNNQNTMELEFQSNRNSQMTVGVEFSTSTDSLGSVEQEFPASVKGTDEDSDQLLELSSHDYSKSSANSNNSTQDDDETVIDDQSTFDCSQSDRMVSCETKGDKFVQRDCDINECSLQLVQDQNHSFSSSLNDSSLLLAAFDIHQHHDNHLGNNLDRIFDCHLDNNLDCKSYHNNDLDCDIALNNKCNNFTSQQHPTTKNARESKSESWQEKENIANASVIVQSDVCCGGLGEGLNTKRTRQSRGLSFGSAMEASVSVTEVLDMPYSEDLSLFLNVLAEDQPIEAHPSPHIKQTLVCEDQVNLEQKSNCDPCENKLDRVIERNRSNRQIENTKENRHTQRTMQDRKISKRNEQHGQLEKNKEVNTDLSPQDLFEDSTVSVSTLEEVQSSQQLLSKPDIENNSLNWSPCVLDKFDCDYYSDKDVCRDSVSSTSGYHQNKCPHSDKSYEMSSSCNQLSNKKPCNSCPRQLFSKSQLQKVPHYVVSQNNLPTSSRTWNSSPHINHDKSLFSVNTSDHFPSVLPDSEDLDDFLNNLPDDKEITSLAPQCETKNVQDKENREKQCTVASNKLSHSYHTSDVSIANKDMKHGRTKLLFENVERRKCVQEICDGSIEHVTGSEHGQAWQDVDDFDGSAELFSQSTDVNSSSCITPSSTSLCDKPSTVVEQHCDSLKTIEDSAFLTDTSCVIDEEMEHSSSFNLPDKTSDHKRYGMSSKSRKVRFSRKRRVSSVRELDCRLERYYSPRSDVVFSSNQKIIPPTPQRSCIKQRLAQRSLQGKMFEKNNVSSSQSAELRSPMLVRESAVRAKHLSHINYKTARFSTPVRRISTILPSPSLEQNKLMGCEDNSGSQDLFSPCSFYDKKDIDVTPGRQMYETSRNRIGQNCESVTKNSENNHCFYPSDHDRLSSVLKRKSHETERCVSVQTRNTNETTPNYDGHKCGFYSSERQRVPLQAWNSNESTPKDGTGKPCFNSCDSDRRVSVFNNSDALFDDSSNVTETDSGCRRDVVMHTPTHTAGGVRDGFKLELSPVWTPSPDLFSPSL